MANHIKLLNDVGENNPNGNGVAVVGFIQACQAAGITNNDDDDLYCIPGSWCVNEALKHGNTAWVTATDDPKASTPTEFFVLSLLKYGWSEGWAGKAGEALSCRVLADYTRDRIDALFGEMSFGEVGESYNIKVGISDESSILDNIFIGKCGSHNNQDEPSGPILTATGTAIDTITIEASNIHNADRTIVFKRRGETATWHPICQKENVTETFSHNDHDVESSGRELPYYYQIRTMNGAGVGVSDISSGTWRIHTESHKVTFMYEAPQETQSTSAGIWWELPYDSTLNSVWNQLGESVRSLGVQGYVHVGWFTEPNGRGTRITEDARVLKAVTYYADWTAMTQDWLNQHPPIATASNGDIATAATMMAANGCRSVGECYALGIDPEDPDDDLKITDFKMEDGKPVITLNHTEDGSGNSFEPRIKTLGKATLSPDEEWREVPDGGDSSMRFFKVTVEMK